MRIIAGESKGRRLKSIKGTSTRPTLDSVKESVFNIITPYLLVDKGLDLFAGFGGIGLEGISRGVKSFLFVEKDYRNSRVIQENIALCGYEDRGIVKTDDVFSFLKNTSEKFDLIFMDPPYNKNLVAESLYIIKDRDILNEHGIIVAEHEADYQVNDTFDFTTIRQKIYGDSAISVLSKGGVN